MDRVDRRQLWADAALLLVTLIWGSTFVMVKDAVASYPVFPFLTLRFGMATVALLIVGWRRLQGLGWQGWGAGALIGLFLFAGYAFQTYGLKFTTASKAGFITGLYVAMVPALSCLVLRKRPSRESLIGVALAILGLALLSLNADLTIAKGDGLILLCALAFALHIIAVGAFAPKVDPIALTLVQVLTVTLISGVISLAAGQTIARPSAATLGAAAFTGVLATAVAFGLQTAMQRFTTPTHTALIFTGEPVFAALFGVMLGGDVLTAANIAGGVLIICGTVISEVNWSEKTAVWISRFFGPQYVALPLLLTVALSDPVSWRRGLFWSLLVGLLGVAFPVLLWMRQLRTGAISDWHVSDRQERMQRPLILISVAAGLAPFVLLSVFDGPRYLLVIATAMLFLIVINTLITVWWKISQHVTGIALSTTLITALLGVGASPVLLLIPLVAWARVKVGAHTVLQTIAGGVAGVCATMLALRVWGLA